MQKNRTNRSAVSFVIAGALAMSSILASILAAQGRPPRPGRDAARAATGDSQPSRRESARSGMRGMPDAHKGMARGGPGNPGMRGMPRGQGGFSTRAGMGNPASAMLRMRAGLDLSEDQVRRLQQIEIAGNRTPDKAEMLRARADLMDAMRGDGNLDGARAAMERMNRLRTDQALAGLKARQDARNVLTAEQRSRADNASANARRDGLHNRRGNARDNALGRSRSMAMRNREMARRGAMLRQSPRLQMRLRGPDLRRGPGMRDGFRGGDIRLDGMQPGPLQRFDVGPR